MNNFHHHHNNFSSSRTTATAASPDKLLEMIKPDIRGEGQRADGYKKLAFIGVGVCFVLFALGGFLTVMTMGRTFPIIIIAFIGFGTCGVLSGTLTSRAMSYSMLVRTADEAMAKDITYLHELSICSFGGTNSALLIVRKLIETGNIPGYEIIADRAVAKTGLRLTADMLAPQVAPAAGGAPAQYIVINQAAAPVPDLNCDNCGAPFSANENFCSHCGTKRKS